MSEHLTATEESTLLIAAQDGDREALARLVAAYEPWLMKLARQQARNSSTPFDDLHQDARLAFMESALRANPHGFRLSTQVGRWVKEALSDSTQPAILAIPARTMTRFWAIQRSATTAREAAEKAPEMGMSTESFWTIYNALPQSGTLPEVTAVAEEESTELQEALNRYAVADLMERADLSDREREVLVAYYGLATDTPLLKDEDVSAFLGLSRPTVQRVRVSALDKLRQVAA